MIAPSAMLIPYTVPATNPIPLLTASFEYAMNTMRVAFVTAYDGVFTQLATKVCIWLCSSSS